jgi:hypothetical protein
MCLATSKLPLNDLEQRRSLSGRTQRHPAGCAIEPVATDGADTNPGAGSRRLR